MEPFKHMNIMMLYFTQADSNSSKPQIKVTAAAAAANAKNRS
jgi:hypothetical protein